LVVPAELLHAQYAEQVLDFVGSRFARTKVVVFEQRVFPGALEEVVLLLAEGHGSAPVESHELIENEDVGDLELHAPGVETRPGPKPTRPRRRRAPIAAGGASKLLAQLLPARTRRLYEKLAGGVGETARLGELASVDIGAVTGANDFFLLAADEELGVPDDFLRPAVSKAIHIRGARFATTDYDTLLAAGTRCRLFVAGKDDADPIERRARKYLERGIASGIHKRYKCRVRSPWWSVPLPKHEAPSLFLTYCASEHPRLVLNEAQALHTNTLHGVSVKPGVSGRALAASFPNSLTLLSAELAGRSYGGGVLKLEPTEAENLVIPPLIGESEDELHRIDELLRASRLEDALNLTDRLTLEKTLGLSASEIKSLRAAAERLRSRRRARGKAPARG
jgi:adenine-specific DNA methylase